MENEKIDLVINHVRSVLGNHEKYFSVQADEILVNEDDYFSMTVKIEPRKELNNAECIVKGSVQIMEMVVDDCSGIMMIAGEDNETELTLASFYQFMYWCEAAESV